MSDGNTFNCEGCSRSYAWKEQLAGKRVKCKCGHVMTVPEAVTEPEIDENALYDLADAEAEAAKSSPSLHRVVEAPVAVAAAAAPSRGRSAGGGRRKPAGPPALGYQRGPTQREQDRLSSSNLIDKNRDVYAPIGILIAGLAINVGYYAIRHSLGGGGILALTVGLSIMTAIKAALLIGIALAIAGPLGVSFGGPFTAALKLAAITAFTDGLSTVLDGLLNKMGAFGLGFYVSIPIVLTVYWGLLTYLFSMDPGDSYMTVAVLAVLDFMIRTALVLLMLKFVLSMGGISGAAAPVAMIGGGGGPAVAAGSSELAQQVAEAKERNALMEARKFMAEGRQEIFKPYVDEFYAAGCPNVWFQFGRDFNGKPSAECLVVELPPLKESEKRQKCRDIRKRYLEGVGSSADADDMKEDKEAYLIIGVD